MSEYLISLDQGTTSTRAILYQTDGTKCHEARIEIHSTFPQADWVEQDPEEILSSCLTVLQKVVQESNIGLHQVLGIGLTNQRETTLIWDKNTGKCIYPAIVWQDKRTAALCQSLADGQAEQMVQAKTGLLLNPYFSASKISWILETVPNARQKAKDGALCFGTVDSFLIWHLAKDHPHLTDVTNASRTLIFNIQTFQWDDELLALFNIPRTLLPEVRSNCENFAVLDKSVLGSEIPLLAVMGDQQAASIGQGCIAADQAKATYGTGCFLLRNTGKDCIFSKNQLLTTVAYQVGTQINYALEGSIFIAGALFKWMKRNLSLFHDEADIEHLIQEKEPPKDLIFVPALSGLGAPFWDPKAKGAIFGLTQDTDVGHIIRAGLEGVCYQTYDVLSAFENDCHRPISFLKVDGGMAQNAGFLQSLSNCLHLDIYLSQSHEATAFGMFLLAALQKGIFSSLEEAVSLCKTHKIYNPRTSTESAQLNYQHWLKHVEKVKHDSI